MNQFFLLFVGILALAIGSILGYYARQSIAKKQAGTLEEKIQKKISEAKNEAQAILTEAKGRASRVLERAKKEIEQRQQELLRSERLLLRKEEILEKKSQDLEQKEIVFQEKVRKVKAIKENLENLQREAFKKLEKVAKLSKEEAKRELFESLEREYQIDLFGRIKKLEKEGEERFFKRAKEILATAIQKVAISQAQEITTTTLSLPSDEVKGRIIGKEGRNIKTLERLTGVEIVVDDTPEVVIISGFDPIRRQIAKMALEKLISNGRIQPARIEEEVKNAESEILNKIKEAGEEAVYEVGTLGLHPKIIQLLGRLKFRASYGQNVLLHSIEVAHLAGALAEELGANSLIAKKAGLLHDIGKSVDHQVEGSHTEIGIKILEKFGIEKEVITAMKSHHEEYPYESLESVIVQVADQISGARPGARKDTVENYLKRISDLEGVALAFPGVEKAWALQAGRELRVFVKPEEIDDLGAQKLAKEVASRIEQELRYPGEIKVTVVRENRIVEYAR